jgi:hypothetical protein
LPWLPLRLTSAPVVVILAGHCREHVQQHAVDRLEHPARELISVVGGHHPGCRQIQRHHADTARCQLRFQLLHASRETRQTVNLLD